MKNNYLQAAGKMALAIPRATKERFRSGLALLDTASGNIKEAGELFAGIDEAVWAELINEAPAPMRRTLSYVRDVGEGKMIPQLATASGEAAQRLRGLPLEEQSRLWTEPVEMFAPGRVGRAAKYQRFVTEMDSEEVKRAFARDGSKHWKLRSYEEQKAWVAEQGKEREPEVVESVDRPGRWAVRNGKVFLSSAKVAAGLSRKDVELILRDLGE